MNHASLCTGIGGFDLAAQWCGWENVFQVEKDAACKKVLIKNFGSKDNDCLDFYPEDKSRPILYSDIFNFNGKEWHGKVNIISAGFPCQPFSVAGKQKGAADSRFLWPQVRRVVGEVRPGWFVGENVVGIVKMALDEVLSDLEDIGYTAEAIRIPACSINAPHRRERVWIIAHSDSYSQPSSTEHDTEVRFSANSNCIRLKRSGDLHGCKRTEPHRIGEAISSIADDSWATSNSNCITRNERQPSNSAKEEFSPESIARGDCRKIPAEPERSGFLSKRHLGELGGNGLSLNYTQDIASFGRSYRNEFQNFPTQPPVCGRNDGFSNRVDRLKQLGNAIVPQVAYEIFSMINRLS